MREPAEKIRDRGDSNERDLKRKERPEVTHKGYLSELFTFACVLKGEVKYLEKIKEYIIQEYVDKGLIKLIRPTYDKSEIYLVTSDEWKEYQKLKKKEDEGLIGYRLM